MIESETFYLVLARKDRGYGLIGKLTARQPRLGAREICMELKVSVPRALFVRPSLVAKVSVPDGAVCAPVITTHVADNIAEIIRDQTGLRVEIAPAAIEGDA